jgi:type III secretion protein C
VIKGTSRNRAPSGLGPLLRVLVHVLALIVVVWSLVAPRAESAEPKWPEEAVTLQAQQKPLADFLRDLFNAAGMRALPSDAVQGRISGRFSDPPRKIFDDIVKAYDLLPYYDGTVMHVSAAREMTSKTLRVAPDDMTRVSRALARSKLEGRHQSVQLSPEEGLIKVRGAPEFVTDIQELVGGERRPAPAAQPTAQTGGRFVFRSFTLKYASAADQTSYQNGQEIRIPGVVSLLRSMTGSGGGSFGVTYAGEARPGRNVNVQSVRGRGLRRYDREPDEESGRDGERGDDRRGGQEPAGGAGNGSSSGVRIEADPNLNTVMVRDTEDSMPMYEQLIAQLDQQPQLIEIQVTIIDIDRTKLHELGVDWRFDDGKTSIAAGGGTPAPQNGGLLLNTVLGNAGNFLARVNALAQKGSAQVISRPQVLTLSNLEAVLATDQSFFVRVAGNEDVDLFDVSVGTSLRVVPMIAGEASDPQIRLRVAIEDGSLSPDASVDNIPIVERSQLNTQAVIFDGQSLLLGGLTRDRTSKDTTKVPVLGDVPGVGRLFRRTTDINSSEERLFLISPRIVASNAAAGAGRNPAPRVAPPAAPASSAPPANPATAMRPKRDPQSAAQPAQGYLDGF